MNLRLNKYDTILLKSYSAVVMKGKIKIYHYWSIYTYIYSETRWLRELRQIWIDITNTSFWRYVRKAVTRGGNGWKPLFWRTQQLCLLVFLAIMNSPLPEKKSDWVSSVFVPLIYPGWNDHIISKWCTMSMYYVRSARL